MIGRSTRRQQARVLVQYRTGKDRTNILGKVGTKFGARRSTRGYPGNTGADKPERSKRTSDLAASTEAASGTGPPVTSVTEPPVEVPQCFASNSGKLELGVMAKPCFFWISTV